MFKLNTLKPINYSLKIGSLFVILHFLYAMILSLPTLFRFTDDSDSLIDSEGPISNFIWDLSYDLGFEDYLSGSFDDELILFPLLLIISMFIHFKSSNKELKFMDYLKVGWIFSTIMFVYSLFYLSFNYNDGRFYYDGALSIFLFLGILSSLLSVFFPKGTIKEKLGNLVKVVLFVIVIYNIIKPFIGGNDDEEEVGFDTDGDGKIDTTFVDTDGDGIAETIAQDTDGDGIIDTVSSDTDGDGLIDTVVADTDGDGLTDTVIKDIDVDGDGNSDYRVTKRKGKGLS